MNDMEKEFGFDVSETDSVGVAPLAGNLRAHYSARRRVVHMVFKTKARTVDAMRLEYSTWSYMVDFGNGKVRGIQLDDGALGAIVSIPGGMELAREGDWIVRGADGKMSIVKDEAFNATYEPLAAGCLDAAAGVI
jgi:hypothetical protein